MSTTQKRSKTASAVLKPAVCTRHHVRPLAPVPRPMHKAPCAVIAWHHVHKAPCAQGTMCTRHHVHEEGGRRCRPTRTGAYLARKGQFLGNRDTRYSTRDHAHKGQFLVCPHLPSSIGTSSQLHRDIVPALSGHRPSSIGNDSMGRSAQGTMDGHERLSSVEKRP